MLYVVRFDEQNSISHYEKLTYVILSLILRVQNILINNPSTSC